MSAPEVTTPIEADVGSTTPTSVRPNAEGNADAELGAPVLASW